MKNIKYLLSLTAIIIFCLYFCFYSQAAKCVNHDFSCADDKSNVIHNSDGTHSFKCLNDCGNIGTEKGGVGSKEVCDFKFLGKTEATCTENGKQYYVCQVCFFRKDVATPVKEHDFDVKVTPPICEEKSYKIFICTLCSYSYTETQKPSEHISDGGIISDDLSDTEKVTIIYTCRVCGVVIKKKTVNRILYDESKYNRVQNNITEPSVAETESDDIITIAKVRGLKLRKKSRNKIRVTWKKVGCEGYQIVYSVKKTFQKSKTSVRNCRKNIITLKNIKAKKYFLKIRAYKKVGGKKIYGPFSKVKTFNLKQM